MFHPFLVLATSKPENVLKRLGLLLRLGLGVNKNGKHEWRCDYTLLKPKEMTRKNFVFFLVLTPHPFKLSSFRKTISAASFGCRHYCINRPLGDFETPLSFCFIPTKTNQTDKQIKNKGLHHADDTRNDEQKASLFSRTEPFQSLI